MLFERKEVLYDAKNSVIATGIFNVQLDTDDGSVWLFQ